MANDEMPRHARIWPWVLIVITPLLLYWFSVGPFVHWMQSARTQKEYETRVNLGRGIYAPVIWLQINDPTGVFNRLTQRIVKPWEKLEFNETVLPDK